MTAFQFRMPAGIPGNVTRIESAIIVPEVMLSTNPVTRYGDPCAYDATTGNIRPIIAGDTAASVVGFLVRPFPTQSPDPAWPNDNPGVTGTAPGIPNTRGICNVLKAGFISVAVVGTTLAVKGTPVYVRVAGATSGTNAVGDIEAAADATPANTIKLANAFFRGPQDANGNCEIQVFAGIG
jgi:hypothetical protein